MTFTGKYTAAKQFEFVQATPALTWTIVHNLGGYPIVDLFVTDPATSQITKIMPISTVYIDNTTIEITFAIARAGTARLIG
jgi:hypothetical protein